MKLTFYPSLLALIIYPFIAKQATAQIIPDNTLPNNSQVQNNCTNCEINGGTIRGVNLYHSFQKFSVPTNGKALFNNNSSIENIITRVTGNSRSNIDGIIQTNGTANLFLINPNGIIFGENASLKIDGSFTATTSESLIFDDDSEFSASNPQAPPLLTVNITPGLQYGSIPQGTEIRSLANLSVDKNLNLITDNLFLQGKINAGNDIQFTVDSNIQIQDISIAAVGGDIDIDTTQLNLTNTDINTKATTVGGEININVSDATTLINSNLKMDSIFGETPGDITIYTNQLNLQDKSSIIADQEGKILINANILIMENQSQLNTNTQLGTSGDIQLQELNSLQLNNSEISANTIDGTAGDIIINASDFVNLDNGSRIASEAMGNGDAGSIEITTGEFTMLDSSQINVNSPDYAGFLRLTANNVTLNGASKIVGNSDTGIGGDIEFLNLTSLQLSNNSEISASTQEGEAGDIIIKASEFVTLETDSKIASQAVDDHGIAGFVEIQTKNFTMRNSEIDVNSQTQSAGNFLLIAETATLENKSQIEANTFSGIGGNIQLLNLTSLQLSDNSEIIAITTNGEAGDITINASDFINLDTNASISSAATEAGKAGLLNIKTNQFTLNNGANINVNSQENIAGDLYIVANLMTINNSSKIVGNTVSGIGGNIQLENLNTLELDNQSFISASTIDGEAGDILIDSTNLITLDNNSRIASEATGTGDAGFIEINTGKFTINNEAVTTVSSPQGEAGFLTILADTLILNQGKLLAETGAGETGENAIINLFLQDLLLMRNNSTISAQAFNTAQGGNINIDVSEGFLVAFPFENSDINANADQGNGGIIDIITQSIFGTKFREVNTSQSDITASSQFGVNGEVNINTLDIDPTQGILSLPAGFLDVSNQIAQGCGQGGKLANQNNQFIISGKGGLPSTPNDLFTGTDTLVNLVDILPNQDNQNTIKNHQSVTNSNHSNREIVEAQGWIVDNGGNIYLVANVENTQPQSPVSNPLICQQK